MLSMTAGSSVITVTFPPAPDQATLEQKRQALEASPGIVFAEQATLTVADESSARGGEKRREHRASGHGPVPGGVEPAQPRAQELRVPQGERHGAGSLQRTDSFHVRRRRSGLQRPRACGHEDHGWRVSSVIAAASFYNSDPTTGANPYAQCLNLQGVQAANVSMAEADANIWQSLPWGKVIVNVSLGHTFLPTATLFGERLRGDSRAIGSPTESRSPPNGGAQLPHERDDDILIAHAPATMGTPRRVCTTRCSAMPGSRGLCGWRVAADLRFAAADGARRPFVLRARGGFEDYPSLFPSAALRGKLLAYVMSQCPTA